MDQFESLTPEDIAKRIAIPIEKWPRNCFRVVTGMIEQDLVDGVMAGGSAAFAPDANFHFWVKKPAGRIVDPLRWFYEHALPNIWVGPDGEEYDEQRSAAESRFDRLLQRLDRTPCYGRGR